MRSINSTISSQLDAGRTIVRELVKLELGSGTYGFARSAQPIVFSGTTYQPLGVVDVSGFSFGPGTAAEGFTIKLPASNDDGRLPTVLQGLYAEDYRDRPVTVLDVHFNADTGAVITAVTTRFGYINELVKRRSVENGDEFLVECLSRSIDYSRRNGRQANGSDQQRRAAGDLFFEYCSQTGRVELYWGRARPS